MARTSSARPRSRPHRGRRLACAGTLLALFFAAFAIPATAGGPTATTATAKSSASASGSAQQPARPAVVPVKDRSAVLGSKWRTSSDRSWTTTGDAEGFHLLVADEKSGYAWRNAATLREPGFEADQWIGNACVTGSGRRAVVVYAPRAFTNSENLMARGGFTAVVDLDTGAVHKLAIQTSLAYFNPGCGTGETAVLTQSGDESLPGTRLVRLDVAKARLAKPLELPGQVTSAIPVAGGSMVAADGASVVRITQAGARSELAPTAAVPFDLTADRDGGVVYLDRTRSTSTVRRIPVPPAGAEAAKAIVPQALATGSLDSVGVTAAANGSVYVTGSAARRTRAALPSSLRMLPVARDARVSTAGQAAVVGTSWTDGKDSRADADAATAGQARPVDIAVKMLGTGRSVGFTVDPLAGAGARHAQGLQPAPVNPAIGAGAAASSSVKAPSNQAKASVKSAGTAKLAAAVGSPTDPVEAERYCSVPRNDPHNQALQPKPRQVEWAVDQAITNNLDSLISRPANWKNLGMPAYRPQDLFPRYSLDGSANGRVPAQIMLGVAAQESNLWMSSQAAVPGETGNPLVGNFYGRSIYDSDASNDWDIHWDQSDCGYGITQVTDHMRLAGREKNAADKAWDYQIQRAVALDYTVNIAAGLEILATKWNQTYEAGLTINNADPSKMENWFYAIWAYNSGFHPQSEASANDGSWGVGWGNNPVNPAFKPNRDPFLEYTYSDAAHPQDWPYPEKVIGFAGHPPDLLESPNTLVSGYRAAWWNGTATSAPLNRQNAKPPVTQFCDATDQCEPGALHQPNAPGVTSEKPGPCAHKNAAGQYDLKCWYNKPSTWKADCSYSCGNEVLRFDSTYAEQADGTPYPPNCSLNGLPYGAMIIDDLPDGIASTRPGCGRPWSNSGTFSFAFGHDANGLYPSKVDLHQINGGFGGHFYFGHTRRPTLQGQMKISGRWSLNTSLNSWVRIMVHLPDHGAQTQQARYEIDTGNGLFDRYRYVNQRRQSNSWVSLGVYKISGAPQVRLSTDTDDGTGDDDIAFDAVAFQTLAAKPKNVVAVLGDSYASGEGAGNYYPETDTSHGTEQWNACRRSKDAWGRRLVLPGMSSSVGALADAWDPNVELGFVACSGAMTYNVQDEAYGLDEQSAREGQFREQKQVRSGVLSPDTTLVMLTLGGNDQNAFSDAVTACGYPTDCSSDSTFLPTYEAKIDTTMFNLETVLRNIAAQAPNAQIMLMGYPELLSRTISCAGALTYNGTEAAALATLANYMDAKQNALVDQLRTSSGLKINYANPIADFVGHGGCDATPWINIIVSGPQGDGDFHPGDPASPFCIPLAVVNTCLSRASFHPKVDGTGDPGYAGVMRKALIKIGYSGT